MTSGIEWTEETWNPIAGCSPASPGCDNRYAAREAATRFAHLPQNVGITEKPEGKAPVFNGTIRLLPEQLNKPLHWKRPRRIFVCSRSDLFHPDVDDGFIADLWWVMKRCPQHTFQVLTKRPKRMMLWLQGRRELRYPVLPNVWVGTSIESDQYAWRADHLRETPAAVRWISAEPLLGPLPSLDLTGIDWLVVGGESGKYARPMHPDWVRDLRDRCTSKAWTEAPAFFFKQWGEFGPVARVDERGAWTDAGVLHKEWTDYGNGDHHARVGKKAAGRLLDGREWSEYPA